MPDKAEGAIRMKSEDESIKMLEMRMQRQLSLSREQHMTPQNIQYYISSATLHRESLQSDMPPAQKGIPDQAAAENPQASRKPSTEKTENPPQENAISDQKIASIEKEHEAYRQKLPNYGTKESVQKKENSESEETRQLKGQNEYKKILRAVNAEAFSETEISLFDGKI